MPILSAAASIDCCQYWLVKLSALLGTALLEGSCFTHVMCLPRGSQYSITWPCGDTKMWPLTSIMENLEGNFSFKTYCRFGHSSEATASQFGLFLWLIHPSQYYSPIPGNFSMKILVHNILSTLFTLFIWRICLRFRRQGFESWVRKIPQRRKWQPTPVFLPGESHGRRSLVSMGSQRVGHDWVTSLSLY